MSNDSVPLDKQVYIPESSAVAFTLTSSRGLTPDSISLSSLRHSNVSLSDEHTRVTFSPRFLRSVCKLGAEGVVVNDFVVIV